jgi:uncharacterized Zn finger protein (UPF0148 family)
VDNADNPDRKMTVDIKKAASFLMKGGTLIGEPCNKCGGAQVKFKEKIYCINCGKEQNIKDDKDTKSTESSGTREDILISKKTYLKSADNIIEEKIFFLTEQIKDENDIEIQRQKANLVDLYLRILEQIRHLDST